ncbi:DUF2804 domain-containing protein [Zooshikella harenae]|uniref:DUF2804 domain-containing protein n=1 Tax=Zooshikella harenae TaxID=2827238 RepID=A0ABS5Z8L0_9GAMM|nr:DUF2804 domain-containing protein [Zooshikella harenae]MBU2710335.1 DUF2804 domain-containing protein [Zooshikella harenae]
MSESMLIDQHESVEQFPDAKLIQQNGQPRFGIIDYPISEINYRDCRLLTPMGKVASRWQRWFGFNAFQYYGIISPEIVLGCALVDTKLVGLAFCYLYHPPSKQRWALTFHDLLSQNCHLSLSPDEGGSYFKRGNRVIVMKYDRLTRTKSLRIELPNLNVNCVFDEAIQPMQPLRICTRCGPTGWVYAQKVAGLAVQGEIHCEWGHFDLSKVKASAHHDFSAGYMRRETFWNWACLGGRLHSGEWLGLNLSAGVNETSFTENCYWLDGQLGKIDHIHFDYHVDDIYLPWHITSYDKSLNLTFTPLGAHRECLNLWLMATNFHQLYGYFSGTIETGQQTIQVDNILGFVEEHYAKW